MENSDIKLKNISIYLTCKFLYCCNIFCNSHDRDFKKYLLKFSIYCLYIFLTLFFHANSAIVEILLKKYGYHSVYVYPPALDSVQRSIPRGRRNAECEHVCLPEADQSHTYSISAARTDDEAVISYPRDSENKQNRSGSKLESDIID